MKRPDKKVSHFFLINRHWCWTGYNYLGINSAEPKTILPFSFQKKKPEYNNKRIYIPNGIWDPYLPRKLMFPLRKLMFRF